MSDTEMSTPVATLITSPAMESTSAPRSTASIASASSSTYSQSRLAWPSPWTVSGSPASALRDEPRHDLLRMLARPVVVERPHDHDRQPVGDEVRVGEPVGARLRRGVGAARIERMLLVHRIGLGRPVDLARRDQDESLDRRRADRVEQDLRPLDVRRHELGRALGDRLLDVRLGCGVDDHVDLGDDVGDELRVSDVAVDERQPLVRHHVGEVLEVAGVGERVERDDLVRRRRQQMADDVRRDEPGAAGDESTHSRAVRARRRRARGRSCTAAGPRRRAGSAPRYSPTRARMNPWIPRTKRTATPPNSGPGKFDSVDPEHDPVGAERDRDERADGAEHDADPLDRLRPEAGQDVEREPRQPQGRVARRPLRAAVCATSTSTTLAPPERTSAFVNFCLPIAPSIGSTASRRYALNAQPKSEIVDPREAAQHAVDQPRRKRPAPRVAPRARGGRSPRRTPPSTASTSRGMSSGAFWRSPSIVTTMSPRARARPACIAGCWPKFRLNRTARTRGVGRVQPLERPRTCRRSIRRRRRSARTAVRLAPASPPSAGRAPRATPASL